MATRGKEFTPSNTLVTIISHVIVGDKKIGMSAAIPRTDETGIPRNKNRKNTTKITIIIFPYFSFDSFCSVERFR
jgi:hypothetical protein